MNGREALKALSEGKPVRRTDWSQMHIQCNDVGDIVWSNDTPYEGTFGYEWEIVEEPATDAELVNALRQLAYKCSETLNPNAGYVAGAAYAAYDHAADMLEKRSIK